MPLVLIRHLPNCRPYAHCIINESTDGDVDDQEHYLKSEAERIIEDFKDKYTEFKDATFYMDIVPLSEVR